jgi:hypothetical protein
MAKAESTLKHSFIGWLISIPIWLTLCYVDHGKAATYMKSHLFLTAFCPLLLLFLVLFVRAYYLEYKR